MHFQVGFKIFITALLLQPFCKIWPSDVEQTNYRSGISMRFEGTKGISYAEEYLYHDKKISDRRVIFIKDDTKIIFAHNETNSTTAGTIGINGSDGIPNSGDEGTIRYRVDRDMNYARRWASPTGELYPAYVTPLSFAELKYDGNVPVVGTTGPVPNVAITNRNAFYFRGLIDTIGDEWHTISVADDDRSIMEPKGADRAWWASDGKVHVFVVNPRTPCLTLRASGSGQFYTTPPKAYFTPKINAQTSYILATGAGQVSFQLTNLDQDKIVYRVNGGSWVTSLGPTVSFDSEIFKNGENTLEYYNAGRESYKRLRRVVKNPDFPSRLESHGNLMWGDFADFDAIRARLTRPPYAAVFSSISQANVSGQNDWDASAGQGKRTSSNRMLINAFVAKAKGWDATASGKSKSYAVYAKEMLIDHVRNIDPLGFELNHSSESIPTRELHYRGYWDVLPAVNGAFAYDLLINGFRSDQNPSGITSVEDYFIRDTLAGFVFECLQWLGYWNTMEPGMWGISRNIGGLCIAAAMPSYSTSYYGTSGFDGSSTSELWAPYPNQAITWKRALLDNDAPIQGYPNLAFRSGTREVADPLIGPGGNWGDKVAYTSYGLMGQHLEILANMLMLIREERYPSLEQFFLNGSAGTLVGGKDNPQVPRQLSSITVVNRRFPRVAESISAWIGSLPASNELSVSRSLTEAGVYGLVWYDDSAGVLGLPLQPTGLKVVKE